MVRSFAENNYEPTTVDASETAVAASETAAASDTAVAASQTAVAAHIEWRNDGESGSLRKGDLEQRRQNKKLMEQRRNILVAAIVEHEVCACVCSQIKRVPIPRPRACPGDGIIEETKVVVQKRVRWLIKQMECEDRQIRELERQHQEISEREGHTCLHDMFDLDEATEQRRENPHEDAATEQQKRPEGNHCKRQRVIQDKAETAVAAPSTPPERCTKSNAVDKACLVDELDCIFGEEGTHVRGEFVGEESTREDGCPWQWAQLTQQVSSASFENGRVE